MEYFLERIARQLNSEFGANLNRHCIVFPGRRAGLYMIKYLSQQIQKPAWSPAIFTINELFTRNTRLQLAGNEMLLGELYKAYRTLNPKAESFDEFYFWGDMILNDFDDVDKYLVDPAMIFGNVRDYKEIDQQFGSLTEEQVEIIRRFWKNFDPTVPTREKESFVALWSILHPLYEELHKYLRNQNLAYEGMIFRELAEGDIAVNLGNSGFDLWHFIGFNALNECEKKIMLSLKKEGRARFYWDYDVSFLKGERQNSAGLFMEQNIALFGNDMPAGWEHSSLLSDTGENVKRKIINASSDIGQAKLIPGLISELSGLSAENAHHTAIILADENLLLPVLSSLPENSGAINITMGYPLRYTQVYTLVRHLSDLQRSARERDDKVLFGHEEVSKIIRHSLVSELLDESEKAIPGMIVRQNLVFVPSEKISGGTFPTMLFRRVNTPVELSAYFREILSFIASGQTDAPATGENDPETTRRNVLNEFIYRVVLSLNRLEVLVKGGEIVFSNETYLRILDKLLRTQSVPFSGEPLTGIQIMGILESRALDFSNLIILSVNEGILPAISSGSSFIPYSLREAFGLPSANHQESVFAYHFYRLLQRAENVTFVYNSNSEGLRSGEMSRFLLQMKYEMAAKPEFSDMSYDIRIRKPPDNSIARTGEHQEALVSRYSSTRGSAMLSPSAINTWLGCSMRFYYRYVNGLKEPEKISSGIDPALFGSMLHLAMKNLYAPYLGSLLERGMIEAMLKDKSGLSKVTTRALSEVMKTAYPGETGGNEIIAADVLMAFLERILGADRLVAPLHIKELEQYFGFPVEIDTGNGKMAVTVGGQIDRIDESSGITRIVDYKTGSVSESVKGMAELFINDRKKEDDAWLQTLIYCEAWLTANPGRPVRPSVYQIKRMTDSYSDKMVIRPGKDSEIILDNYEQIRGDFIENLKQGLAAVFNVNEPFVMTEEKSRKCSWCPYRKLCMR